MDASYRSRLERNIRKYSWYKIFTSRVYLPLITIQLVTVGKVTLEELAIIVIVSSIVQAVLQVPSGYIADKIGNRKTIILGAAISVTSPLFYAFMPSFGGGIIAASLFFAGWSFQSGAVEAFMHDTLIALRREKDYAKIMGRAQTYGLVGAALLVALIPLTYPIHHTLPFIIGFFSLGVMLWLTISFQHPIREESKVEVKSPILAIRSIVTAQNIMLFVFAGFLSGAVNKGGEYRELLFQDLGIAVALFGFFIAGASILGAVFGWFIHVLDRLKPTPFYLFDLIFLAGCLVLMGLTANPIVAVAAYILYGGYGRVRMIVFQAKMLHEIKHAYKATLLSALNAFRFLGEIVAIILLTKFITLNGYPLGYVLFGCAVFAIGIVLWLFMVAEAQRRREA